MPRLFISYSRVDRPFVDDFVPLVRDVWGYENVWFDDNLHGGQIWWEEILSQIAACDIFVYLLTNDSVTSEYCQAEYKEAQRLQKQILPVQIRARTNIPVEISQYQIVDMSAGIKPQSLNKFHAGISRLSAKITPIPPPPLDSQPVPRPSVSDVKPRRIFRSLGSIIILVIGFLVIGAILLFSQLTGQMPDTAINNTQEDGTEDSATQPSSQVQNSADCPQGETTVTVAGGVQGTEYEVQVEQAGRYMAMCPNITVEFLPMPAQANDRLSLYQGYWEGQSSGIDVFQVDATWAGIIAPHMVDLREHLREETISKFFPRMVGGQTIDGRLVALPWSADVTGLYYRTDLLEVYDVSVPSTWDELVDVALIIQDGERSRGRTDFYGYLWPGNESEGLECNAHEWLVSETGVSFIRPEGEVTVNNPEFVVALERAAEAVGSISPEAVTNYSEEAIIDFWKAGNAAFMWNWTDAYARSTAENSLVADVFDFAPLPAGSAGRAACYDGWQLAVSRYSDSIDAAVDVVEFLTSLEEQKQRALSPLGAIPTISAVYNDPDLADANPLFARITPALVVAFPRPWGVMGEQYSQASTIFFTYVHDVLTGRTDAQTAVEDMEVDLRDLIDRYDI